MKRLFIICFLLLPILVYSQGMLEPTKWNISYPKNEIKLNETVEITFSATINDGWHFYSLGDEPPQASFTFDGDGFETVGKMKESDGAHKEYDKYLTKNVSYFEKTAEFRQKIKITSKNPNITIELGGQACLASGQCVMVNKTFTIKDLKIIAEAPTKAIDPANPQVPEKVKPKDTQKALTTNPTQNPTTQVKDTTAATKAPISNPGFTAKQNEKFEVIEKKIGKEESSLFGILLLAFGAGLLSLLTPCVFPMIPLTVTFFTTSSSSRNQAIRKALFYGFSIVIIFTLIGIFAGPFLANVVSTHWIPNLIFFLIFMIFGLSFLGLFEITLPSSFVNKVDQQSEKGGYYGVFFMAFTLVLVSFSCTGPIVGFVLFQLQGAITLKPILSMLAFSLAFAIPFTLFALFPQWLQKLPKSGGWMNVIKVVLGFIEIALAFKFLSMIDQVYHLHLLDREIYIAIWIVIFALMGFYLLGKIKLPHDSDIKYLSVPRLMLSIIPFVFVLYLLPGMIGAPLKFLSGYLPPMSTHDFDLPGIIRENVTSINDKPTICSEPKYNGKLSLPHGLKGYFTYEEAIECAKEKNLPVFVDITGHACVNCREMEANVWSDPQVLKKLKNDFVIATLYVDDRTLLDKEDQYQSPFTNKLIKTLGEKNTELSVQKFKTNAQPLYVLIDPTDDSFLVKEPIGYEPSAIEYLNYLDKGIQAFNLKHGK